MKSKVTLIILLSVILFLGALSFFFGYHYLKTGDELEALTARVNELTQTPETDGDVVDDTTDTTVDEPTVVQTEKLAIANFDASKVDNSARTDMTGVVESGTIVNVGDVAYRIGPKENITSSARDEINYQIRYKEQTYTLSETANIVDVRFQNAGVSSKNYMIILMDDGTIKYSLIEYEATTLEFKDYTQVKDVVALVNVANASGRPMVGVGLITSDGVTHILPYEMP